MALLTIGMGQPTYGSELHSTNENQITRCCFCTPYFYLCCITMLLGHKVQWLKEKTKCKKMIHKILHRN